MTGLAIWMPHLGKLRSRVIVINYCQGFVSPEAASSTSSHVYIFFSQAVHNMFILSALKCSLRAISVSISGQNRLMGSWECSYAMHRVYTVYTNMHTYTCIHVKYKQKIWGWNLMGVLIYLSAYLYICLFIYPFFRCMGFFSLHVCD